PPPKEWLRGPARHGVNGGEHAACWILLVVQSSQCVDSTLESITAAAGRHTAGRPGAGGALATTASSWSTVSPPPTAAPRPESHVAPCPLPRKGRGRLPPAACRNACCRLPFRRPLPHHVRCQGTYSSPSSDRKARLPSGSLGAHPFRTKPRSSVNSMAVHVYWNSPVAPNRSSLSTRTWMRSGPSASRS